jgi:DNA-binding Xre family transcriptional regulator
MMTQAELRAYLLTLSRDELSQLAKAALVSPKTLERICKGKVGIWANTLEAICVAIERSAAGSEDSSVRRRSGRSKATKKRGPSGLSAMEPCAS